MTGCHDEEFTCWNGQCIPILNRCDQVAHCKDESDESVCHIVSMSKNYNKNIPPFTKNEKAQIQVSIDLLSINDISEMSLIINLKFTISLEWYETSRIIYNNLKHKQSLNVLSKREIFKLWTQII